MTKTHYLTMATKSIEALIEETNFRCNITASQCEVQNCLAALKRFSKQNFPSNDFQTVDAFTAIYEMIDYLNSLSEKGYTNFVNNEKLLVTSITYKIFDALNDLYQYV